MRSLISVSVVTLTLALVPATTQAQPVSSAPAARATKGLVVKNGSWGPLKLGMSHTRAQKTGMVSTKVDHCAPGYQMVKKYRSRGFVVWKGEFPAMSVEQIIITGAKEHTARHIHIGSTLRQLRHAYPRLSKVYSAGDLAGQSQGGDDLYAAFTPKTQAGTVGFQFAYGKRPKPGSKIATIVIAPARTVFWGC